MPSYLTVLMKTASGMHHYNFPSYSVGETKPSRGPGRREIVMGRCRVSLLPVTSMEEFPYTIRLGPRCYRPTAQRHRVRYAFNPALMDAGAYQSAGCGHFCGLITEGDVYDHG